MNKTIIAPPEPIHKMMKDVIRAACQKIIGYRNYLFLFSLFTIQRLRSGRYGKDFIFFMGLIPEEGIILDIGANIGIMTASLARRFPGAKVYAFEPIPDNMEALEKVVRYYTLTNVQCFQTALAEAPGTLSMIVPVVNHARMQGLSHVWEDHDTQQGIRYTVPATTLDIHPLLNTGERITAIKIDVENFEYPVLKGGEALLQKHRPLIYCELWNNERRKPCIDYLTTLGYTVSVFNGKKLVPFTGQEAINFFFLPTW